jgi:L-serine deaminase
LQERGWPGGWMDSNEQQQLPPKQHAMQQSEGCGTHPPSPQHTSCQQFENAPGPFGSRGLHKHTPAAVTSWGAWVTLAGDRAPSLAQQLYMWWLQVVQLGLTEELAGGGTSMAAAVAGAAGASAQVWWR